MGSITPYETAGGRRWRVRYRTPEHAQTDKRGFTTKHAAELYLANIEVSKATGAFVSAAAARVTVGELAGEWLANKKQLGHKSAAMILDTYADLFEDDLDEVTERLDAGARGANIRQVWEQS